MTGDHGVEEKLVLVNQIQPVQLGGQLAAPEQHAYFGFASSLTAHSHIARGAFPSPRATADQ